MMYTIFVHFPSNEGFLDDNFFLKINMPYVPRKGDYLFISNEDFECLERKILDSESFRKNYSKWLYGNKESPSCSLEELGLVKHVTFKAKEGTIHVEIAGLCDSD